MEVCGQREEGPDHRISVVTNAAGRFAFPTGDSEPDTKAKAWATDMADGASGRCRLGPGSQAEIKLESEEFVRLSPNAEWLISMLSTDEQKRFRSIVPAATRLSAS
jgi:hypothetical protein